MPLELPFRTILKVFAMILVGVALYMLWPLLLLIYLSILVAVTLDPLVEWMSDHRVPRGLGIVIIAAVMIGFFAFLAVVVFPPLIAQIGTLAKDLPQIRESILGSLPKTSGIQHFGRRFLENPGVAAGSGSGKDELPRHLLNVGGLAISGISEVGLLLILSLYFLADGKTTWAWILAFFTPEHRLRLHRTAREMSKVIFAYVAGQFITSALVLLYAFGILTLLGVPAALMLAILAGIFDILPILGFFLSTIPAVLLALTVSSETALYVFLLYLGYHALENYFIVPKVYGNRLRLSTLAVLLALLAGGILAGIPGAIAVLPIVASYPIIEKIWLVEFLGWSTVTKHIQQEESDTSKKVT